MSTWRLPTGRLARSSLATSGMLALRVVTQAATLLLLVRVFPPDAYGQLVAAATLAVVMGVVPHLGAGFLLMSRIPRDTDAAADTWRYVWPLILVFGTALLSVYLPLSRLVGGAGALPLGVVIWLGAAELLCAPFTAMLSFALQAHERVPLSQLVQWMPLGLRALAVLPCFVLPATQRTEAFAMLQCGAALLGAIAAYAIVRRIVHLDWKPRRPTREELREGASFAGMHLVAANSSELDKVVAVRAVGAYDAGLYNASGRILVAVVMPVLAMLLAAQPRLFQHAHAPSAQGERLVRWIASIAAAWGVASGLLLAACSPLLPTLFGPAYAETAQLMPWVAFIAPFLSMRVAAGTILVALGRPLQRLAFEVGGVLMLACGMLALARFWGLYGAVVAVIAAELTMAAAGWGMVYRRLRQRHIGAHG